MRLPRVFQLRLRTLVARRRVQAELDEEFQYHLDRQIDENVAAGMSPAEARIAALRSIQDFELRKEECRDMRGWNALDNLAQDLKYAFRQLRKNQIFATTAILVLALGICASVAIFTFVDSALLKPLPYKNPSQLVAVYESVKMFRDSNLSYLDYVDWNRMNTVFSSLSAYRRSGFAMSTATGPLPVRGALVSNGFFRTLGVVPTLGRDFAANEGQSSAPRTAILSFDGWRKHFGASDDVLGKAVTLEGETYTVVGVLPRDFHFAPTEPAEFWVPLNPKSSCESRRSCHDLFAIGRLKEGVSLAQARANLIAIAKQLEQQYPDPTAIRARPHMNCHTHSLGTSNPSFLFCWVALLSCY